MPRRPAYPLDSLMDAAADYLRATARDITKGLGRAVAGELGLPSNLKDAVPMRIKRPKTWTQLCNWLAGLGLGNKYYPDEGPITITEVKAITVHAVCADGQERQFFALLSPEWQNPWTNDDGTGPRRKVR